MPVKLKDKIFGKMTKASSVRKQWILCPSVQGGRLKGVQVDGHGCSQTDRPLPATGERMYLLS